MANPGHVEIFLRGVGAWNQWRDEDRSVTPDLSGEGFVDADLRDIDLRHAVLHKVDFTRAKLMGALLAGSDLSESVLAYADLGSWGMFEGTSISSLRGAKLCGADLREVNFLHADLRNADLTDANLYDANLDSAILNGASLRDSHIHRTAFRDTDLAGTDFTRARMADATLVNLDLSKAVGLDRVNHQGPSSIGLDTFYSSHGRIPESFLRGCGLPEMFIDYARSLVGQPFDYHSVFISYSHQDEEFAQRLYADLQAKGVRCWYAPEDMKIGDKFREVIDRSIHVHDKLLLVLSGKSVRSDWVEKEVETAMEKERKQSRTVLFPIRLDDAVSDIAVGWPADIRRTRHIGNFSDWKNHDAYKNSFERLLRDLKSVEKSKSR